VAVPQSKPFRIDKIPDASDRNFLSETSASPPSTIPENLDERAVLSFLKELIAGGNHGLDAILGTITDVARQLTGACGAALAMWKEGAMVCRARSGDTAPVLGAQLSVKTGISGECLRTGKIQHCADTENDPLVDLEVCRSLGLRSIAVLPIRGWRGINGILEVFSTKPAAFTEKHIALLRQLAVFAERARTSQPESAWPDAPKLLSKVEKAQPQGPLPASDRVEDVAVAPSRTRSRTVVLGALIGLVAMLLLAGATWLGWRARERANRNAQAANTVVAATADAAIAHPPASDTISKANPGTESLSSSSLSPSSSPSRAKPSAAVPVKLASKVDVVAGKKTQEGRAQPGRSPAPGGVAANVVVKYGPPAAQSNLHSDPTASVEPLSIPAQATSSSALSGVLSAKASLPGLSVPVSQGVSGGQLVHRVPPVYPAQARLLRLEGTVVLAAAIMEDGTVHDVKVVQGPPVLAQAAVDAVQQWRFKPFQLDGKPVKNETRITVDFKLPSGNH
jgi:TonB family protein